ncbi:uncharacterized protein YALI1_E13627g [Yarrowia lipolytica]|uniref:Uncharacterized protein n=1 Tax=Yarrowia lipolytica TaxID=4952 RepID=A0A1D8NHY4_YARLL|nr:hypothetical protein YALI1_E13627g [Yarrowia lipolytica]
MSIGGQQASGMLKGLAIGKHLVYPLSVTHIHVAQVLSRQLFLRLKLSLASRCPCMLEICAYCNAATYGMFSCN